MGFLKENNSLWMTQLDLLSLILSGYSESQYLDSKEVQMTAGALELSSFGVADAAEVS
jgi:hypothetical protein